MNSNGKLKILLATGVVLLCLGCFMGWYGFRSIFEHTIRKKAMLVNGTKGFSSWRQPTSRTAVYLQFFMFNITNGAEVRDNGAKPVLREVGPFSFIQRTVRGNLHWSEDQQLLNYTEATTYHFDPATSGADLTPDTEIVTLNLPLLLLHKKLEGSWLFGSIVNSVGMEDAAENAFIRVSVNDLLFNGLKSQLFGALLEPMISTMCAFDDCGSALDIAKLKEGRFRPAKYNGSSSEPVTVYTGAGDWSRFGQVFAYGGARSLSYWRSDYCNMLNGTDGKVYPPGLHQQRRIYVFNTNLCRSLYLDYEKDVYYYGIRTRRFVPPRSLLEEPAVNEDNRCFCAEDDKCLKTGAISLSACKKGKPIVASTPHFYNGAAEYVNAVEGLSPDKELHQTFVDIEPMTGLPLNGANRLQFNIELGEFRTIAGLENLPDILLPFMYTNETAKIDAAGAERFEQLVQRPLMLMQTAHWLLIGVGGVMTLVAAVALVRRRSQRQEFVLEKTNDTVLTRE